MVRARRNHRHVAPFLYRHQGRRCLKVEIHASHNSLSHSHELLSYRLHLSCKYGIPSFYFYRDYNCGSHFFYFVLLHLQIRCYFLLCHLSDLLCLKGSLCCRPIDHYSFHFTLWFSIAYLLLDLSLGLFLSRHYHLILLNVSHFYFIIYQSPWFQKGSLHFLIDFGLFSYHNRNPSYDRYNNINWKEGFS